MVSPLIHLPPASGGILDLGNGDFHVVHNYMHPCLNQTAQSVLSLTPIALGMLYVRLVTPSLLHGYLCRCYQASTLLFRVQSQQQMNFP
jgi:hypothetical protein